MNQTIESILERRSIRKYKPDPIPDETVQAIVDTGLIAASSCGRQARHLCVISSRDVIDEINALVKQCSQVPGYDKYASMVQSEKYTVNFFDTPLFVITSGDPTQSSSPEADCALMLGNMFNAAHSLGLGSCWINQLTPIGSEPAFRAFLTLLGVPENYRICGAACFGYPAVPNPQPHPRKDGTCTFVK